MATLLASRPAPAARSSGSRLRISMMQAMMTFTRMPPPCNQSGDAEIDRDLQEEVVGVRDARPA